MKNSMTQILDRMQCRVLNELTKKLIYGYGYCIFDTAGVILFDDRGQEIKVDYGYCLLKKLQFSTGFKDKNGKMIFEGDILQFASPNVKAVVYFDDFTCSMKLQPIDDCGVSHGEGRHLTKYLVSSATILGNQFENPEFLENGSKNPNCGKVMKIDIKPNLEPFIL